MINCFRQSLAPTDVGGYDWLGWPTRPGISFGALNRYWHLIGTNE